MKWNTLLVALTISGISSVPSWSLEPVLQARLEKTSAATGQDYVKLRDSLVAGFSTNELLRAASDGGLEWRERLVARIVLERKLRGEDIQRLRNYDWPRDSGFDPGWSRLLTGFAYELEPVATPRLIEAGLWYHYIEISWKHTGEDSHPAHGRRLAEVWPSYARYAMRNEPEAWYLGRASGDFIRSEGLSRGKAYFRDMYSGMLSRKESDAVPSLLEAFDSYFESKVGKPGHESFPGRRNQLLVGNFDLLIQIADARHAELLEAFIAARPALEPLREKLAEVQERPAPEPVPEPPFRVMRTPDFLKTGPFVPEQGLEDR